MERKNNAILICRGFPVGGIEVSSVAFINNMYKDLDLDVFVFSKTGKLLNELPSGIKIYQGNKFGQILYKDRQSYGAEQTKSKKFKLLVLLKNILRKLGLKKLLKKLCLFGQKKFTGYDVAICFDGMDISCSKMTLCKVKAKVKICFIHCDPEFVIPTKRILKYLYKFDKIYCVSSSCATNLKKYFIKDIDKIGYLYNFQNCDSIKMKANEFKVDYDESKLNIVSVSRLSPEKAHIRSLKVFKTLHDKGYNNFVWHVLGEGQCLNEIQKFIFNNDMSSYVKLYGNQINPYPYIKAADLFYLGSYHEAAPMVYAEAKMLGTMILSTNTCSAKELVGDYGVICDNDEESIYNMFSHIFKFEKNLLHNKKSLNYDNNVIKEKFNKELELLLKR